MDPNSDSKFAVPIEGVDRRQNVERGGYRLTGVVVVGLWPTEAEKDPVSAIALHIAPVPSGHRDGLLLVGLDQVAVFLCIGCRRKRCRADKVAEDHCDGAQLGPESDTHRFGESADAFLLANTGAAHRAEAGAVGQHLRAGVAVSDHEQIDPDDSGCDRAVVRIRDGRRRRGIMRRQTRPSGWLSSSCPTPL